MNTIVTYALCWLTNIAAEDDLRIAYAAHALSIDSLAAELGR